MIPNKDQIWAVIRWVLTFGGGILVAKGYLSAPDLTTVISDTEKVFTSISEIIGPVSALIAIISSLAVHTKAATVVRAAEIVPIPSSVQKTAGVISPIPVPTRPKEM